LTGEQEALGGVVLVTFMEPGDLQDEGCIEIQKLRPGTRRLRAQAL
jgi:hypothetical protein